MRPPVQVFSYFQNQPISSLLTTRISSDQAQHETSKIKLMNRAYLSSTKNNNKPVVKFEAPAT